MRVIDQQCIEPLPDRRMQQLFEFKQRARRRWVNHPTPLRCGIAAAHGRVQAGTIAVFVVEQPPALERLQQLVALYIAQRKVELGFLCGLGQQFGHTALQIRPDLTQTLGLAVEGPGAVQVSIVVELHGRL